MLISVIMVTYNAEKLVETSLLSLLRQDYSEKEIIIIDGASTDKTVEIINKYLNKIAYFVSEPDEGIHDAINKGIGKARGDIIGFLNAGDWYTSSHVLSRVANEFLPKSDVYSASIIKQTGKSWRMFDSDEDISMLYKQCGIQWLASFFRNTVFFRCGGLDKQFRIAGDHDYFLTLYENKAVFQFAHWPVVVMIDGGISSDLRKGGYRETFYVQCKHGVPVSAALPLYCKRMVKANILQIVKFLNLEDIMRAILNIQIDKLSSQELKKMEIDVKKPWFLKYKG